MTSEETLKRVTTELMEGIQESLEAVQTNELEFAQAALNSLSRAKKEVGMMATSQEKEFVGGLCAYLRSYINMRFPVTIQ